MKINIKKYQAKNFKQLDQCLVELQDYLVKLDNLKRLRRTSKYSPEYTKNTLKKVVKHDGVIYLACVGTKVIGCIIGVIEEQAKNNLLECVPTKSGRVLELYVADAYRSCGIGKRLLAKMESYMRRKKCNVLCIEVFEPNQNAYKFYLKHNYQARIIDLVKLIK